MIIERVWEHTWAELVQAYIDGDAISSYTGHLIASKDRKLNDVDGFNLYCQSVRLANRDGKPIPDKVLRYFEIDDDFGLVPRHSYKVACMRNKKLTPAQEAQMVVNRKNKPFSWSFSAINDWVTCPLKYAHARFYCDSPFEDSEALRWGNFVHKALENRVKHGARLPDSIQEYEKYAQALLTSGGKVTAEMEIAVTRDLKVVSWFSKEAWGRCKVDVTVDKGKTVMIGDWKTGKVKTNELQLDISAAFASLVLPEAEIFIPKFIFLKHDTILPEDKIIQKSDIEKIWERIRIYTDQMEESWETEVFSCKPSGLCRQWCSVLECEHNGRR